MNGKITVILALAILVLQINLAESQVVRDGLVNYWTFDTADVDGNTVKDAVGSKDGTLIGAPKQVTGKFGQAFKFNGKPDFLLRIDRSRLVSISMVSSILRDRSLMT